MAKQNTKTAVINVKVDAKMKEEAGKLADHLGISISMVVQGFLRQFVYNKGISFFAFEKYPVASDAELRPTPRLLHAIRQAEKGRKNGDTRSFDNPQKAVQFLQDIRSKKIRV